MTEPLRSLRSCLRRAHRLLAAPIELALVGAIAATIAASLAYAAGWISPGPITPVTSSNPCRRATDSARVSLTQGGLPGAGLRGRRLSQGQPLAAAGRARQAPQAACRL